MDSIAKSVLNTNRDIENLTSAISVLRKHIKHIYYSRGQVVEVMT